MQSTDDLDLLTNAMVRESFAPLEQAYKSTVDMMTSTGLSPAWLFACLTMILMGRSFGRVLERVTDHVLTRRERPSADKADSRPDSKKED